MTEPTAILGLALLITAIVAVGAALLGRGPR